jgi:hypothetical protein
MQQPATTQQQGLTWAAKLGMPLFAITAPEPPVNLLFVLPPLKVLAIMVHLLLCLLWPMLTGLVELGIGQMLPTTGQEALEELLTQEICPAQTPMSTLIQTLAPAL